MARHQGGEYHLEAVSGHRSRVDDLARSVAQPSVTLRDRLRLQLAVQARHLAEQHYDWTGIGRRFVELVEGSFAGSPPGREQR